MEKTVFETFTYFDLPYFGNSIVTNFKFFKINKIEHKIILRIRNNLDTFTF
jgi:hypothetical protein